MKCAKFARATCHYSVAIVKMIGVSRAAGAKTIAILDPAAKMYALACESSDVDPLYDIDLLFLNLF